MLRLKTGSGNLIQRAHKLEKLGASNKKSLEKQM